MVAGDASWWLTAGSALALPTVCGALVLLGLIRRSLNLSVLLWCLAGGHLLGLGLTALIMALLCRAGFGENLLLLTSIVVLVISVLVGLWVLRSKRRRESPMFDLVPEIAADSPWALRFRQTFCWSVLLWSGLILALVSSEVLLRPLYPWDAWSAWSVKARVWAELGVGIDFVGFRQWLAHPDAAVFTNEAWNYPETLPLVQLWMTGWLKVWDPVAANLPWLTGGLSMMVLIYHSCRLFGAGPLASSVALFLLTSAPILTTQMALAGYADLWLSASMVLFVACLTAWIAGWLSPAALCLSLGLIGSLKLEGLIWVLVCAAAIAASRLPAQIRLGMLIAGGVVTLIWWVVDGFSFSAAGLEFVLTPQLIEIPYLGRHPLAFSNQLGSLFTALIELPNWHLVWVFGAPAAGLAIWRWKGTAQGRGLSAFLLTGLGFLFVLFFFTQAAAWAESMTASNRLALHLVPAAGLWVALLLVGQHSFLYNSRR